MRFVVPLAVFTILNLACFATAEDKTVESGTASCSFADDNQVTVEYKRPKFDKRRELPLGGIWTPGDTPMTLFAQTTLTVNGKDVPVGAYVMYFIPQKKEWTLVISKNVTAGAKYDPAQDLLRAPMEIGQLSEPANEFTVYFGHLAPKDCSMRVDFGRTRAWVEFNEK